MHKGCEEMLKVSTFTIQDSNEIISNLKKTGFLSRLIVLSKSELSLKLGALKKYLTQKLVILDFLYLAN